MTGSVTPHPPVQRGADTSAFDAMDHGPEASLAHWYREGWYSDHSSADELMAAATNYADASVVFAGAHPLDTTVGDINREAVKVAGALHSMGVQPGDAVAVQLPSRFECAVAYEAVHLAGAILIPIVHIYGTNEVEFILTQSKAKVLIMPDRWRSSVYTDRIAQLRTILSLEHVVIVGDDVPARAIAWADLVDAKTSYTPPSVDADDVCLLIYTSGTTAAPKGVQHSHNSFLAEQKAMTTAIAAAPEDVQLVSFPPGHIAGVSSVFRPLLHGSKTVYVDAWDPQTVVDLITEHSVTSTAGTPFHLTGILDLDSGGAQLSTLREFLIGAAAVPEELVRRAEESGIKTFRCYGLSEHPTVTCGSVAEPIEARLQTDGPPMGGVQIRILDETGTPVAAGVDGEVVTRGPDQFVGYLDADLNAEVFTADGWLRTGDLGHLDINGRLTITDRLKDVIIRAGETLSSGQIEEVLNSHPSVVEGVVVAAPDRRYGEVAAAIVVLRPGEQLDLDELRAHFATSGLARQKTPEQLLVVDSLPRTSVGKIRKADLRRQHFSTPG